MEENKKALSDDELEGAAGGVSLDAPLTVQPTIMKGNVSGGMTTADLRMPMKKKGRKMPKGSKDISITEHDSGFKMV